jgi:hypothetical protein
VRLLYILSMVVALGASIVRTATAQSDASSANSIAPGCRAFLARDVSSNLMAEGYCLGMVEAYLTMPPGTGGWCLPKGVTIGQGIRVVVSFIDRNPARTHEKFQNLVLEALHDAWPCPAR